MTMSREDLLWSTDGGVGAHITKWRVRKPHRLVFNVERTFDGLPFTIVYESFMYRALLEKQVLGNHLIFVGMPMWRKRYREHPNILLIRAIPTGLSYQVE